VFVGHDILVDQLPIKRQAIEQFLLLAHLNAVETTGGRARVQEASFRFQPLSSRSTYQRYFGCDVRFDQSADGVVFSEEDLHCPTVLPDAQLYAKATSFVEANFPRIKPPMRTQVRAVIVQWIETTECNKERVAAELHMHPRTLHRRLNAEGTCFEKIKDEIRRDIALGYLRATGLSLQRIAEKVGYAEHSVLTRSCSRWFAASPREVRRHMTDSELRWQSLSSPQIVPKCRDEQRPSGEPQCGRNPDSEGK
jgi:AraC-like DNA-binding protein